MIASDKRTITIFDLEFKTRDEACEYLGISKAFLSMIISGQRPPSKKVLDLCGYRKVITYEKISSNQSN